MPSRNGLELVEASASSALSVIPLAISTCVRFEIEV